MKTAFSCKSKGILHYVGYVHLITIHQEEKFDVNLLNSIADQQWIGHYTDLHMPLSELFLPFRDTNGWYSIEVLLKAVDNLGDSMVNLSGVLNSYFTKPGLRIIEALNSSHSYPMF